MRIVQLKSKLLAVKQRSFTAIAGLALMMLPGAGFSQEPGSNPDVPLDQQGVPFDSNMNIALLLVGVVFAVIRIRQLKKKKATLTASH